MERSGDNGKGYESHLQGFVGGDTRDNIVWHITCDCYKMEVGRDAVGGLSSKSKKRELIVKDA